MPLPEALVFGCSGTFCHPMLCLNLFLVSALGLHILNPPSGLQGTQGALLTRERRDQLCLTEVKRPSWQIIGPLPGSWIKETIHHPMSVRRERAALSTHPRKSSRGVGTNWQVVVRGEHIGCPLLSGPTLMCLATNDSKGQTTPLSPFATVHMRSLPEQALVWTLAGT